MRAVRRPTLARRRRASALALVALLVLLATTAGRLAQVSSASAADTGAHATLVDIEDEVMCTQCGTVLNIAESLPADRQRAYISDLVAQGLTKDQIKERLVDQYGEGVLAMPRNEGFNRAVYLLPVLAAVMALGLVFVLARRWRRQAADEPHAGFSLDGGEALSEQDDRRLDAELAALDP